MFILLSAIMLIQLHVYDDVTDVMKMCKELSGETAIGCTQVFPSHCEVHVFRPNLPNDVGFTVIGHEFWHCYNGDFHQKSKGREELKYGN